jgi:hypothetical protein
VLHQTLPWDAWLAIAGIVGANIVSQLLTRRGAPGRHADPALAEQVRAVPIAPTAARRR